MQPTTQTYGVQKLIKKNLQERKELSEPINFAGTTYQRHIS